MYQDNALTTELPGQGRSCCVNCAVCHGTLSILPVLFSQRTLYFTLIALATLCNNTVYVVTAGLPSAYNLQERSQRLFPWHTVGPPHRSARDRADALLFETSGFTAGLTEVPLRAVKFARRICHQGQHGEMRVALSQGQACRGGARLCGL